MSLPSGNHDSEPNNTPPKPASASNPPSLEPGASSPPPTVGEAAPAVSAVRADVASRAHGAPAGPRLPLPPAGSAEQPRNALLRFRYAIAHSRRLYIGFAILFLVFGTQFSEQPWADYAFRLVLTIFGIALIPEYTWPAAGRLRYLATLVILAAFLLIIWKAPDVKEGWELADRTIRIGLCFFVATLLPGATFYTDRTRWWLYRNLFTLTAGVCCLFIIWYVPQVNHLFNLPRPTTLSWFTEWFEGVLFLCGVVACLVAYVYVGDAIIPRGPSVCPSHDFKCIQPDFELCAFSGPPAPTVKANSRFERFGELLVIAREKWPCWWLAAIPMVLAIIVGLGPFLLDRDSWAYRSASPAGWTFAIFLALIAVWWIAASFRPLDKGQRIGFKANMVGRGLFFLLCTNLLGEVVLWWIVSPSPYSSNRAYTMWAIIHVLFLIIILARVLDTFQIWSAWPVRGIAFVSIVAFLVFINSPGNRAEVGNSVGAKPSTAGGGHHTAGPIPTDKNSTKDEESLWLTRLRARIDRLDAKNPAGPVVFVAASGGGSRAALFTSLVLEYLNHKTIQFDKAGPAVEFGDHIALVSSVSGGSVATGYYYARGQATGGSTTSIAREGRPRNSFAGQLIERLHYWTNRFSEDYNPNDSFEVDRADRIAAFANAKWLCDNLLAEPASPKAKELRDAVVANAFVDDMCTDFIAPLLRGVLLLGRERGQSVSDCWERYFGWEKVDNFSPYDAAKGPLILLNATDDSSGRRLAVGFPSLDPGLWNLRPKGSPARFSAKPGILHPRELTADDIECDRGSLTDYDPEYRVRLAEAVRLSANFPLAFREAHLSWRAAMSSTGYPYQGITPAADVLVLDGGIVDNTGIDSLRHVLRSLETYEATTGSAYSKRRAQAASILKTLRRRGLMIVEIDSGGKPKGSPSSIGLVPGLTEPMRALENAARANAIATKDGYVDELQTWLRTDVLKRVQDPGGINQPIAGDLPPIQDFPCAQVTITCNHSEGVITTWALGPDDKAMVIAQFLVEREQMEGRDIVQYYFNKFQERQQIIKRIKDKLSPVDDKIAAVRNAPPLQRDKAMIEWKAALEARNNLVKDEFANLATEANQMGNVQCYTRTSADQRSKVYHFLGSTSAKAPIPEDALPKVLSDAAKTVRPSSTKDSATRSPEEKK
jgi:hypothetical protein